MPTEMIYKYLALLFYFIMGLISESVSGDNLNGELFLTPLIERGELKRARSLSRDNVKVLGGHAEKEIVSYSGYFTIDEDSNANLFFWFFPAEERVEHPAVILWVNELPGHSCLKALFQENGPFTLDEEGELTMREFRWTKYYSMIYIDAPIGSGFSFADAEKAFATHLEEEAADVHEALRQFYILFPEFQGMDLYLAGKLFGVSYMSYITKKIELENKRSDGGKIKLQGFIMGSPWVDTSNHIPVASFYYSMGLIDDNQKRVITLMEHDLRHKVAALDMIGSLQAGIRITETLANFTGFQEFRSVLKSKEPSLARFTQFIDSKKVHDYLHIGLHKFEIENEVAFHRLGMSFLRPQTSELMRLFERSTYRILIYIPQFDLFSVTPTTLDIIYSLRWPGSRGFRDCPRTIWRVGAGEEVAGYVREGRNHTLVFIRNAGHDAFMDVPRQSFDMIHRFLAQKGFSNH